MTLTAEQYSKLDPLGQVLTPVHYFPDQGYWAKRDDLACWSGVDMPSGSKVRQYQHMATRYPGAPMLVGCSAHSAMQIYVAAAAKQAGVKGIVYTAKRADPTDATRYAKRLGAQVVPVPHGYLNVVQAAAKKRAARLGTYVRWDEQWAVNDAMHAMQNLPGEARRLVIPVGSGLVAAGIIAGLTRYLRNPMLVLLVTVSPMAGIPTIKALAKETMEMASLTGKLPPVKLVQAKSKYTAWEAAILPDGTPLDPYYAAKAMPYVKRGDCLWLPGLRPVSAMPAKCQDMIKLAQERAQAWGPANEWAPLFGSGL